MFVWTSDVSDSSELVLDDWVSEDFELETPNTDFKMFHFLLGGADVSEDEESEVKELLLFLLGVMAGSDGAGGTTRSKETNRLAGETWLSQRMMMIRRPGAGVQGADESWGVSSSLALI